MKKNIFLLLAFIGFLLSAQNASAHCEVPCGIYGDSVRIALIKEHISTIEKSMKKIDEISNSKTPNYNQLVRWVNNKEEHASKIQHIVSQYFLHQRIKIVEATDPAFPKYQQQVMLLHHLLVYAMKTKQTTDLDYIKKLKSTLDSFEHTYFHTHSHKH